VLELPLNPDGERTGLARSQFRFAILVGIGRSQREFSLRGLVIRPGVIWGGAINDHTGHNSW